MIVVEWLVLGFQPPIGQSTRHETTVSHILQSKVDIYWKIGCDWCCGRTLVLSSHIGITAVQIFVGLGMQSLSRKPVGYRYRYRYIHFMTIRGLVVI